MPTQQAFDAATYQWKAGDKAFYAYELVTIRDVEPDGRVHGVNTEFFITGGYRMNDRIFPVDDGGKKIADFFNEEEIILQRMDGNLLLNWPSLSASIEERWVLTMRHYHAGDQQGVVGDLYRAGLFFTEVKNKVTEICAVVVGGVPLFNSSL